MQWSNNYYINIKLWRETNLVKRVLRPHRDGVFRKPLWRGLGRASYDKHRYTHPGISTLRETRFVELEEYNFWRNEVQHLEFRKIRNPSVWRKKSSINISLIVLILANQMHYVQLCLRTLRPFFHTISNDYWDKDINLLKPVIHYRTRRYNSTSKCNRSYFYLLATEAIGTNPTG